MSERSIEQRGVPADPGNKPACGKRCPRAGQHRAIGADEVELRGEVVAFDAGSELGITGDLLHGQQPEPVDRHHLAEPRRSRDTQAAIGVVEQRPGSVHDRSLGSRRGRPSATLPAVSTTTTSAAAEPTERLPADDPDLFDLDLRGLRVRWAGAGARAAIGSEAMAGADLKAQKLGVPGQRLMEHAGAAVAAAVRAIAEATDRWGKGKGAILILCGPGNNGGDGFVAARYLAKAGAEVAAVLVSSAARPATADAGRNWDRLDREPRVTRIHAGSVADLRVLARDVDRASVVVDALLGTGVRGALRDPIRTAVELVLKARAAKVPIVAVDTPTAVDLTSGDASDPVVRADLTVTFHRPKTGLLTTRGARLAGKVLVAPIGIPVKADRG
jgi:hydroxyethylthiazole kinase-like uncharacterized protein yjeF